MVEEYEIQREAQRIFQERNVFTFEERRALAEAIAKAAIKAAQDVIEETLRRG